MSEFDSMNSYDNLIYGVVRKYHHAKDLHDDLMQEGRIGILIARKHFNDSYGTAFSTYATYWIRQRIQLCITRHKVLLTGSTDTDDSLDSVSDYRVDDTDTDADTVSVLLDSLSGLSDRDKYIIQMYYFCDDTFDMIASALGISRQAVHQRLQIILGKLRVQLSNKL